MKQQIESLVAKSAGYNYFGLRAVEEQPESIAIGDVLPASRVWDDGNPVDGMYLNGTSTVGLVVDVFDVIENLDAALDSLNKYHGAAILLVGGQSMEYGDDQGEVIIRRATVLGVWPL